MSILVRRSMFTRQTLTIALSAAALLGAFATAGIAGAKAFSRLSPPAAPVIATIDMEDAFDKLTERTDKEAQLKSTRDDMQKKLQTLQDEIKNEGTKLDVLPPAEKDEKQRALTEKAIRAEFEAQFSQKLLDGKRGEMRRDLYIRITESVGRLAKQNGYALVLVSDEKVQIPRSDADTVARAISFKRMIYTDKALDITQDLVQMMNNEYAAGPKGSPGKH